MGRFQTEATVAEILSQLPVKSLLRFRSVCKQWRALIDSPYFIKQHLNCSTETKNSATLILKYYSVYSLTMSSLDVATEVADYPLKNCNQFGPIVCGSCHGLVLLDHTSKNDVVIWNPSTRKHLKLPVTDSDVTDYLTKIDILGTTINGLDKFSMLGIGYDPVSDDYKVMKMIQFHNAGVGAPHSRVKIYSLKSRAWRQIEDFPYYLPCEEISAMYAGGALHWLASKSYDGHGGDRFITALDLATEKYWSVPMPYIKDDKEIPVVVLLEVFEGCLCLLSRRQDLHLDAWVMKEYGVRESWTKLFSLDPPGDIQSLDYVRPLAFSEDGNKILLLRNNNEFVWFDSQRKVVEPINVRGLPEKFHAEVCVQSLVPIGMGCTSTNRKQPRREEDEEKKSKKKQKNRDGFLSKGFKLVL